MHLLKLKEPEIIQKDNSVLVVISHQKLASPEEQILTFLNDNETINNSQARGVCVVREDWRVRAIFKRMVDADLIEKLPGSTTSNTSYKKKA
jgi:ATP-dependent DNA helicase RecG